MYQKIIISLIMGLIILSTFNTAQASLESNIDGLDYKQEIIIPIDTSIPEAKHQPIDAEINFENSCFAKNETIHSVRMCYDDGLELNEIESQIYDLEHVDNTHISACKVVFLIPEEADGKEKYYVIYDSKEVAGPDYHDHIVLEDTHYYYEPIPGQKIDFDYYKITENGYINYLVVQKGELLGNPISLAVAKFKPKSTVAETYNIDQLGVFDIRYGIHEEPGYIGSSWATEIKKNILVDGNLMVRVRIQSVAPRGDVKSDNIYTYYYCPSETKSIFVNANHEVIKTHEIEDTRIYDGIYAGIVSIKSRSATIEKMNVGDILPIISLYGNDDSVKEYFIPQNPDSIREEEIFSTKDDIDLGKKAWVCLRNPSTGKVHGLIMHSTTGLVEGEEDGVQVKAFVKQNVKLPGLEADTGNLFLTKNTYDKGREHTTTLTQGFKVNFDIKLITLENNGYEKIDTESEIFQKLIKEFPIKREETSGEKEDVEKYSVTTYVHLAPSVPLGSLLSAALGKNASYIYAELYKENTFRSSGSASRIALNAVDVNFEGKTLLEIIDSLKGAVDFKNSSLFKKIVFPDLEDGRYIVKIYKENPFFAKERQYIGFAVADVDKDTTIHIYCRPQVGLSVNVLNQDSQGVGNVLFSLEQDGESVAQASSDKEGYALVHAPSAPLKPYTLKIFYQGFLIDEKEITLGIKNRVFKLKEELNINQYELSLIIKDTWGFPPAIDINPVITSKNMQIPTTINAKKISDGKYIFKNLSSEEYTIEMSYKSFDLEKDISIRQNSELETVFPAEYNVDFLVMDSHGQKISNKELMIKRNGETKKITVNSDGKASIMLPPAEYEIQVLSDEDAIAKQKIWVRSEKEVNILSNESSLLHTIVFAVGIILALVSLLLIFWKKQAYTGVRLFIIALILISIFASWWNLNGDDGSVSTSSNTYLVPSKIVSLSESTSIIGGEISQVPEEVTMVLSLIFALLALCCVLLLGSIFTKEKYKKTNFAFSILSIILIILAIGIFVFAMSQITELGVGSFIGKGELQTTLPGTTESVNIMCSWGPSIGFYLTTVTIFVLVGFSLYSRFKKN